MNLLEHKIIEVHNVWQHEVFSNFVEVDLTFCCYGETRRCIKLFHKNEWEHIQKEGVFLA